MTKRANPLGPRLRSLRRSQGLTQAELAGPRYSAAYVSTIEAGRRNPSAGALKFFAERLGIDQDELATGVPSRLPVELELRLQETYSSLFSGSYAEAARAFAEIGEMATDHGLSRIEAKALEGRGLAAERRGEPGRALELYEAAVERFSGEPMPERADAVAGIARCQQMLGNTRLAVHTLETYLLELEKSGLVEPGAAMRIYSSLIWPLSELGLEDQAAVAAAEALRLETRVKDAPKVASMHLNVARQLLHQGDVDDALTSLKRAEDLYRSLNWQAQLARAYVNRAIVLANQGHFEEARAAHVEALHLLEKTSTPLTRARALNELAKIERLAGDIQAAKRAVGDALALLEQVDVGELALAHRELGLCHLAESDHDDAEKELRTAVSLFRRSENRLQVAATYRLLGDLLQETGRGQGALEAYRDGLLSLEAPAA